MSRSTFPTTIDTFTTKIDITASDVTNVNRYRELKNKTSLNAAESAELSGLTITLASKLLSVDDFNKLQDCIVSLESFSKDNIDGYLTNKQAEFNATLNQFTDKGSYDNTVTYAQWNSIVYDNEGYLSKQNNNLNHTPIGDTNDLWWSKISQRGVQGVAGIGLSWCSEYNNATPYVVGNAVRYSANNSIYYCINPSTGNLPTNNSYWSLFMSDSGISVQGTAPSSAFIGQVWVDTSTSFNNIKYWDGTTWQICGVPASKISIADSGNLITATNTEDALQELVTKINNNTNNISNLPKIYPATGTATAITVTTGFFNLVNNQTFTFKASANNSGSATTINADAKGAKSVYKPNTTTAPTFIAGKAYTVWYDTTNVCFFIKASAEGTAVVGDVLAGATFSNDNDTGLAGTLALTGDAATSDVLANKTFYNTNAKSKQTGGIPIKSAATITPSTTAQTIAAGQYIDGVQTIASVGGNASAPEVLEGNTFSSDSAGRAIAGTMPEQGTQTSTIEITGSSKPTKSIAAGHINASVITAQLSASLASSIINTAIVGGVQGTAVPLTTEKKWASGGAFTIPTAGIYTVPTTFIPKLIILSYTRSGTNYIKIHAKIKNSSGVLEWKTLSDGGSYAEVAEPTGNSFTATNPNVDIPVYVHYWAACEQIMF